jgi:hypothetical protein
MMSIITAVLVATLQLVTGRVQTPGCMPVDRDMDGLVMRIRAQVGSSETGTWQGVSIVAADSFTIRPVTNDSLCRLALETLNAYLSPELPRVNRIRLIYLKTHFLAEQAPEGPTHSEFYPQFLFDGTLKKVLFPCPDGRAKC